ncbi:hypothetical protein JF535_10735 [Microbulbifer salipaludis]|uniref:Cupin 2 conserved barrel domain-containing protein n=1 Tax=Microbulbifer salipaludis TaxID=187980 RepID=A0ABS3E7R6_9GAMM|nr:hypothetical protein [Microbulbifer salipaludis]MBN8431325.1 hypothetical protein [Microbulbifer salipaludis]
MLLELAQQGLALEHLANDDGYFSQGYTTHEGDWYDQDESGWVVLLQEAGRSLKAGDFVNIPAHQRHRVIWTSPDEATIWLAVFYG